MSAGYGPADSILESLEDDDYEEIIQEVGDRVVERLVRDDAEELVDKLEEEVVFQVPVLKRSYFLREGVGVFVGPFIDGNGHRLVGNVGDAVVDEIRESQSEEIVEDIVRTTVGKISERDD
ncbi:MAG: hypothetical protein ACOCT0_05075 [Halobacteriota archaeon]